MEQKVVGVALTGSVRLLPGFKDAFKKEQGSLDTVDSILSDALARRSIRFIVDGGPSIGCSFWADHNLRRLRLSIDEGGFGLRVPTSIRARNVLPLVCAPSERLASLVGDLDMLVLVAQKPVCRSLAPGHDKVTDVHYTAHVWHLLNRSPSSAKANEVMV